MLPASQVLEHVLLAPLAYSNDRPLHLEDTITFDGWNAQYAIGIDGEHPVARLLRVLGGGAWRFANKGNKMTTELIDWTTMPEGVAVMMGNVLGEFVCHALDDDICYVKTEHLGIKTSGYKTIRERTADCLRLAPADQQPWLVYEEGVTVLPEWAEVTYLVAKGSYHEDVELFKEDEYPRRVNNPVVQYKLGGTEGKLFKDGWTDNPNEVSE
jgi:hypothetical protein